jgi:hypothetical protein
MNTRYLLAGLLLWSASLTTHAALLGRLPSTPGGSDYQAYYDTALNITWLANANLAKSNPFGVSGIDPNTGYMTWNTTQQWIAAMNAADYLGQTDWQLPTTGPINGVSYQYTDATHTGAIGTTDVGWNISAPGTAYAGSTVDQMAYLYYNELGNQSACDPVKSTATSCVNSGVSTMTNKGPFGSTVNDIYWSGTVDPNATAHAWEFGMASFSGLQQTQYTADQWAAWATLPGDITAVPLPGAIWFLSSGLLALVGVARRRSA